MTTRDFSRRKLEILPPSGSPPELNWISKYFPWWIKTHLFNRSNESESAWRVTGDVRPRDSSKNTYCVICMAATTVCVVHDGHEMMGNVLQICWSCCSAESWHYRRPPAAGWTAGWCLWRAKSQELMSCYWCRRQVQKYQTSHTHLGKH